MKAIIFSLLSLIVMVSAQTGAADGAECTKSSDCDSYNSSNPSAGSVCNGCVFGTFLVYLCVPYATPNTLPKTSTYYTLKPSCTM